MKDLGMYIEIHISIEDRKEKIDKIKAFNTDEGSVDFTTDKEFIIRMIKALQGYHNSLCSKEANQKTTA